MNAQFLACRQLPFCCVLTCQRETEKGDAEMGGWSRDGGERVSLQTIREQVNSLVSPSKGTNPIMGAPLL